MYDQLLDDFTTLCRQVLGPKLTGIYLHGSMAMGCFDADQRYERGAVGEVDLKPVAAGGQLLPIITVLEARATAT